MSIMNKELVGEAYAEEGGTPFFQNTSLGRIIEMAQKKNLANHGDAPWMTDFSTGKSLSYIELSDTLSKLVSGFYKRGFVINDVVLLMGTNKIELALFYLAVFKAGGCVGSMSFNLLSGNVTARIIETKAKFIVVDQLRVDTVLKAVKDLDVQIIVIDGDPVEGCTSFDELLTEDYDYFEAPEVDLDSPVWFAFSSGTTGVPKCIVHTHRTLTPFIFPPKWRDFSLDGRRVLLTNVMIHGSAVYNIIQGVLNHDNNFIFSDTTVESILTCIEKNKPRLIRVYPHDIVEICRHPEKEKYDLSSVENIFMGSNGILPVYEHQAYKIFPNLVNLIIAYGITETLMISATVPRQKPPLTVSRSDFVAGHMVGSSGKVVPFVKIKIIDESGGKLGPNQTGEIAVKSPYLMKCYLNLPEETAKAIVDGWFYTGDQGYYDAEGNLFVIGRLKELVKYRADHVLIFKKKFYQFFPSGKEYFSLIYHKHENGVYRRAQVVPTSIEKHMMTHPAIEDVAVVGLPHDIDGEHPLAFVVMKKCNDRQNQSVTEEELVQFIKERVSDVEQLRGGVRFIERIPRNELGKILRGQLKKML